MLRFLLIGVIAIILIGGFNVQNSFGHQPDFEVKTVEDILDFCEFFYDEYTNLGIDNLLIQHPRFPNLRACVILYEHVAWNSQHQLRDTVLISEIEKYLGSSDFAFDRHLQEFTTYPEWVKKDARMWVDGQIKDNQFAYGLRALIENKIISPEIIDNTNDRVCIEGLCIKETDYAVYSHTSKFENTSTEKFEINKIDLDGILIDSKIISEESVTINQFYLDENNRIPSEEKFCKSTKFLFKIPLEIGQTIEDDLQIFGTTNYSIGGVTRTGVFAQNDGGRILVIDKEIGILISEDFEITELVTEWEKSELIETNIFEKTVGIQLYDMKIPKWVKTTTMWFLDGLISESEYTQSIEYLVEEKFLIV